MNTHNTLSTDLDREQSEKIDPEFTRYFWKNFWISISLGFLSSIGLLTAVVNAESIDRWMEMVLRMIFV